MLTSDPLELHLGVVQSRNSQEGYQAFVLSCLSLLRRLKGYLER